MASSLAPSSGTLPTAPFAACFPSRQRRRVDATVHSRTGTATIGSKLQSFDGNWQYRLSLAYTFALCGMQPCDVHGIDFGQESTLFAVPDETVL